MSERDEVIAGEHVGGCNDRCDETGHWLKGDERMTVSIPLPWANPPISGNRTRGNPYARAGEVDKAKADARAAIRAANVTPMVGANITLHLRPATKRRRDADNLGPTLKVVQDSLVLEGVLPDDSWVHVPRSACHIHAPTNEGPAMWVELTDPDEDLYGRCTA